MCRVDEDKSPLSELLNFSSKGPCPPKRFFAMGASIVVDN